MVAMFSEFTLKDFEPASYYQVFSDDLVKNAEGEPLVSVSPFPKGKDLIRQYYAKKYKTNMSIPNAGNGNSFVSLNDFAANFNEYLASAKKIYGDGDCRIAFCLGMSSTHATPIIYIKENGREGILFADSKGVNSENSVCIKQIANQSKIPIYAIENVRQKDLYSCFTDALLFGRDATAINPETNSYYIPNLLSSIESNAKQRVHEEYSTTILPDELLKTSQISSFTGAHHPKPSGKPIHRYQNTNETLEKFRERYTDKNITIRRGSEDTKGINISSYLRKKGIKFADLMEIQFFINQMEEILGNLLTDQKRLDFIWVAKRILQLQGPVVPHVKREGLYDFTRKFIKQSFQDQIAFLENDIKEKFNEKNGMKAFIDRGYTQLKLSQMCYESGDKYAAAAYLALAENDLTTANHIGPENQQIFLDLKLINEMQEQIKHEMIKKDKDIIIDFSSDEDFLLDDEESLDENSSTKIITLHYLPSSIKIEDIKYIDENGHFFLKDGKINNTPEISTNKNAKSQNIIKGALPIKSNVKNTEKIAILNVNEKYTLNDLKLYDKVILYDSKKDRDLRDYYIIRKDLEKNDIVVDDKVYVSEDLIDNLNEIKNKNKPSPDFNGCEYTDINIIPKLQLQDLKVEIYKRVWAAPSGSFFTEPLIEIKKENDPHFKVILPFKVPVHVKKILDEIEMAIQGETNYRNALENIIQIALQESKASNLFISRDRTTEAFYENILKLLNVNADETLSRIENYINNTTLAEQWGTRNNKLPTTVEKMWNLIRDKNPHLSNSQNKLKQVMLLAIGAVKSNDDLIDLRSDTTKNFYKNIMQFIALKEDINLVLEARLTKSPYRSL